MTNFSDPEHNNIVDAAVKVEGEVNKKLLPKSFAWGLLIVVVLVVIGSIIFGISVKQNNDDKNNASGFMAEIEKKNNFDKQFALIGGFAETEAEYDPTVARSLTYTNGFAAAVAESAAVEFVQHNQYVISREALEFTDVNQFTPDTVGQYGEDVTVDLLTDANNNVGDDTLRSVVNNVNTFLKTEGFVLNNEDSESFEKLTFGKETGETVTVWVDDEKIVFKYLSAELPLKVLPVLDGFVTQLEYASIVRGSGFEERAYACPSGENLMHSFVSYVPEFGCPTVK